MPAALKTPLLEPDFAPDDWNFPAAPERAAATVTAVAPPRGVAASRPGALARSAHAPARIREPEPNPSARPIHSRPTPRPAEKPAGIASPPLTYVRRERHHRPLKLTFAALLCGAAVMGQLVLLLWLHGKTLTSAREVERLDTRIADVSNQIERDQERIAAFDSSPQIKQWVDEKGWRPMQQSDFDDITKAATARAEARSPLQSETSAPPADVEAAPR